MKTQKLTILALFTAAALILSLVESAFPPLAPIPGIRLGLANIVTLLILSYFTPGNAFCVLLARILLSAVFSGQAVSLLYSMAGGVLCFLVMWGINRLLDGHYIFLTSVFGGCFHNVGQILAAFLITGTPGVFAYLPILLISGIVTGLFTGLCAHFVRKFLSKQIPKI